MTEDQQPAQPEQQHRQCRRCHRKLSQERSMRLGLGPVCLQREAQEAEA